MAFLLTFLVGSIGIIIFPYLTINPGVLIENHLALKNNCLACHTLGEGVNTEKCVGCHQLSMIGVKSVNGKSPDIINRKSNLLHTSMVNIRCTDCHTEHIGFSNQNATLNFRHETLAPDLQKECITCHSLQKPEDEIHIILKTECSDCHNTFGWKPSHFKHELLGDKKYECRSCHENKIPDNNLHNQFGKTIQCVQCHSTNGWKLSTYDHSKFFRFDADHPEKCANCHDVNKSFESYTCYNCHEHNSDRIRKEHLKEGIRKFKNCVECHRSGEKEIEGRKESNKRNKRTNN